jgi:uncharacterized protein involved in exopolysaccharide biosynthesis
VPDLQRSTPLASDASRDVNAVLPPAQWNRAAVDDDEFEVARYVAAIRRRWSMVVLGGVLAGAAMFALASLQPIFYEGVTTLLIAAPPRTPSPPVNSATFRALLENGSLSAQVVNELALGQPPYRLTPQRFLEDALTIEEVRGTNIVKVRVRLVDPVVAAEASRRLARKAIELTRSLNQQEGASAQDQLKEYVAGAAARMADAEKELLAFQQRAQLDLLQEDTKAMLDQRRDLLKLIVAIESQKARIASAEEEIKKQDRILPVRRATGAEEALRRTDGTREILDSSNPFINPVYQSLDYEIASGRSKLAALEQELRQLVQVRKLGGEELSKLSELYSRQRQQARLQTNFELAKRLYTDLNVRYEESRTQSIGNSPQLQLVDEAIPPDRPLSRRRLQWAVLGFASGLLCAALAALFLEARTRTFPAPAGLR